MAKHKKYNTTIPKEALKPYFTINNVNYTVVAAGDEYAKGKDVKIKDEHGEVFLYEWYVLKEKQDKYC